MIPHRRFGQWLPLNLLCPPGQAQRSNNPWALSGYGESPRKPARCDLFAVRRLAGTLAPPFRKAPRKNKSAVTLEDMLQSDRRGRGLLNDELLHGACDFRDYDFGLLVCEVRSDGQAQDSIGKLFRNWKGTGRPKAIRVCARKMGRDGIMNQCSDAPISQLLLKRVAARRFHDVKVPDWISPIWNERKNQVVRLRQSLLVALCGSLSSLVPFVQLLKLDAKKGRLELIEARIVAFHVIVIFLFRTVIAQRSDTVGKFWIVRCHRAGVTERAEIFAWIKTVAGGMAERAGAAAFIASALGLCVVFNDLESVLFGDIHQGIHVRRLAVEVNRHDRFRFGGKRRFDARGVD